MGPVSCQENSIHCPDEATLRYFTTFSIMEEDEVLLGWELCLECWRLSLWDFLWVDIPVRLDMDLDLQEDHYFVPWQASLDATV